MNGYVFSSIILAIAMSIGILVFHCRAHEISFMKPLTSAFFITIYAALGEFTILYFLNIGESHFNIYNYPEVNSKTVMIGGGMLGAVIGSLIGLHASLMVMFVPEQLQHNRQRISRIELPNLTKKSALLHLP